LRLRYTRSRGRCGVPLTRLRIPFLRRIRLFCLVVLVLISQVFLLRKFILCPTADKCLTLLAHHTLVYIFNAFAIIGLGLA